MNKPEETIELDTEFWIDNKDDRIASVKLSVIRKAGFVRLSDVIEVIRKKQHRPAWRCMKELKALTA